MSIRQLTISDFAAHCVDELSAVEKGETVVELIRDGKVIATINPVALEPTGGTLVDWIGSGIGTVRFGPGYDPDALSFDPSDSRREDRDLLELACQAYAGGRVSREVAANLANLTRGEFDQALFERRIPSYDEARLAEDKETLRSLRNR